MTRNSRLNCLTGTKNKRLLFKVVKTNWTHNNRPFLDTISTKIEQKVARDEKSKFLTFHTKIACHTVRNVVFFFERFISNPENDEILCGSRDQRKRWHFSVRCFMIQIHPHFQFASPLIAYVLLKNLFQKGQRVIRNRNSGEAVKN